MARSKTPNPQTKTYSYAKMNKVAKREQTEDKKNQ
jgi:hypothetical protein